MFRYIVRRLLQMVLVFIGTTFIVFTLMFAGGEGDPIQNLAGERPVTPAQRAYLTEKYHLDDSFLQRYWYYLQDLLQFDLGTSIGTNRRVADIIAAAFPVTAQLAIIAICVTVIFGVTAGIIAGIRRGSIFDNSTLIATLVIIGIPIVVLAPIAQLVFGVRLGIFPVTAQNPPTLYQLLLPGIVLGALSLATAMRLTRASVAENLSSDFVRTAKSKGLPRRRIIGIHVLRNSLIPIVTFLGVELGTLMGGAIVTERVFNVPGLGFQLYQGLSIGDAPRVIGIVSVLVVVFLVANLIVDLLYAVLDPRIRYE